MYSDLFSASSVQDLMAVLPSLPYAIWETFYVTVLSTLLSLVLGLPLGVLLVAGEKNGVLPLPRWLLQVLNVIINLGSSLARRWVPQPPSFRWWWRHSHLWPAWWRAVSVRWTPTSSRRHRVWVLPPCRSSARS